MSRVLSKRLSKLEQRGQSDLVSEYFSTLMEAISDAGNNGLPSEPQKPLPDKNLKALEAIERRFTEQDFLELEELAGEFGLTASQLFGVQANHPKTI